MSKLVIRDPVGFIIKFLINSILWYKCLIQRYVEIPNFLLILGSLLFMVILIESRGQINRLFSGNLKSANILFVYIISTFAFGFVSSPSLSLHINTGSLVIEFYLISLAILYTVKTRGDYSFILRNYIVLFGLMTVLFLLNPVQVSTREGLRYSINENLNENTLALYISMFAFSVMYYISNRTLKPLLGFTLIGVSFYAIFLTGSRKGFVSVIIFFVMWIFWVYIPDKKGIKPLRILAVVIVALLGSYVLLPQFISSSLWMRLNNLNDGGNVMRLNMYEVGKNLILSNPLLGLGYDGFRHHYGTYSHSTIIEVFVSSGIPIGLLYFISLIQLYVENTYYMKSVRRFDKTSFSLVQAKMGTIMFISIIVSSVYIIHLYDLLTFYNFTLIMSPVLINFDGEQGQ